MLNSSLESVTAFRRYLVIIQMLYANWSCNIRRYKDYSFLIFFITIGDFAGHVNIVINSSADGIIEFLKYVTTNQISCKLDGVLIFRYSCSNCFKNEIVSLSEMKGIIL